MSVLGSMGLDPPCSGEASVFRLMLQPRAEPEENSFPLLLSLTFALHALNQKLGEKVPEQGLWGWTAPRWGDCLPGGPFSRVPLVVFNRASS